MRYEPLHKIYYRNPAQFQEAYNQRFNNPLTRHFDIDINQFNYPQKYRAFLCYTEELARLIESIYTSYMEFAGIIEKVPYVVKEQFELLSILDEVKATNDIEGVHSTRREIRDILDGTAKTPRMDSVVNKYQGILRHKNISLSACMDIRNIYDDFVHDEVKRSHPENELDGEIFRKSSVDIASETGKTLHRGMFPESSIIENMGYTINILKNEDIPFLCRIAVFHYFFAYIHPFYDGNGRTARLLSAYLLSKQFHPLAVIRLSLAIKKHKKEYYKLFEDTEKDINRGDLTPFVFGFLTFVQETISGAIALLKRKNKQLLAYEKIIESMNLKDDVMRKIYSLLLQAALLYGQGISISEMMEVLHKSRVTIQTRIDQIPPEHILSERVGHAYRYKLNTIILKTENH